ncbi:MAG TPA: hypothetical protein VFX70_05300 [Mycobacteriales bacterium]|nr:hypothetical protein [Mycobacteriales bacterium]
MMHIDRQRYLEVVPLKQVVENDLLRLPNVTGVDVGYKEIGGEQTNEMAILVFVREKGNFDEPDRIPARIQHVRTDVIEAVFTPSTTRSRTSELSDVRLDPNRYDPLVGGCSTAPARITDAYGTVGIPVRDNATGQQRVLSCWHVFCDDPNWEHLDHRITQPAIILGGRTATDTIGSVVAAKLGQIVINFGYDLYVDCAVCDVTMRPAVPKIIHIGALQGTRTPIVGELVRKYGATTEDTFGLVQSTNFTTRVDYPGIGIVTFYYQYRITPPNLTMPSFSRGGDSGSIVVDTENRALGMVFAGSEAMRYTAANPMYMVLGALNISLDI